MSLPNMNHFLGSSVGAQGAQSEPMASSLFGAEAGAYFLRSTDVKINDPLRGRILITPRTTPSPQQNKCCPN